jgi:hypothetical protein
MQETEPDGSDWAVLQPFIRAETLSVSLAAIRLNTSSSTIRRLCKAHGLGFGQRGHWILSRVALRMYSEGDGPALRAYLAGDRSSPRVVEYFERENCLAQLREALAEVERNKDKPKRQTMLHLLGHGEGA